MGVELTAALTHVREYALQRLRELHLLSQLTALLLLLHPLARATLLVFGLLRAALGQTVFAVALRALVAGQAFLNGISVVQGIHLAQRPNLERVEALSRQQVLVQKGVALELPRIGLGLLEEARLGVEGLLRGSLEKNYIVILFVLGPTHSLVEVVQVEVLWRLAGLGALCSLHWQVGGGVEAALAVLEGE